MKKDWDDCIVATDDKRRESKRNLRNNKTNNNFEQFNVRMCILTYVMS